MIPILIRAWWTSLTRDRGAQILVFAVPIAFFSIFALVFGQTRGATARVKVAIVNEDTSLTSARLVHALARERGLHAITSAPPAGARRGAPEAPLDRARATAMVRDGEVALALVIPAGIDSSFARFDGGSATAVELLTDPADPVAPQVVAGLLQKDAMTAMPDLLARRGLGDFEKMSGGFTPHQRAVADTWLDEMRRHGERDTSGGGSGARDGRGADDGSGGGAGPGGDFGLARVHETPVVGMPRENGMVAFYAAGIAVMFLMFASSAGGGALLDEVESGTLDRVLTSEIGMNGLIAGKFTYLMLLGILQITVMFLWAMIAFRLNLAPRLPGFLVMTLATSACTAAFGLVLATACRTRAQLGGISTLVILSLNALGGSMFPRFLMSESMQRIGLATFNAWALDGYLKVFWRSAPLIDLWPQVAMLVGFTLVFYVAARLFARRWEAA